MGKSHLQDVLERQLWYRIVLLKEKNVLWLTGGYDTKEMAETSYIDTEVLEWRSLPILGIKNAEKDLAEWERIINITAIPADKMKKKIIGLDRLYSAKTKKLDESAYKKGMSVYKKYLFKNDMTEEERSNAFNLISLALKNNKDKIKDEFDKEVYDTGWHRACNVFIYEYHQNESK